MVEQIKIAQQGYEGSYHDIVRLDRYPDSEMMPFDTFHQVVRAVDKRQASVGIMAVENSIYGDTPAALELRTNFSNLVIVGEAVLGITHRLHGAEGAEVTEIRSHQVAIGQCREKIHRKFPEARVVESVDTALAANEVAELVRSGITDVAAIASRAAGRMHPELVELDSNMNDYPHNNTRFIIFKHRSDVDGDVTEDADKTTARLTLPDKPNSLLHCMQALSSLDINYTSLQANAFRYDSRDGEIVVPIEFTHAWHDDRLTAAIYALDEIGVKVHNLGSYASGRTLKV